MDGGNHFFVCTHIKDRPISHRHHLVKKVLISAIERVNGCTTDLDSPGSSFGKGVRQDIEVFLGSKYYLLDVCVKHPTAKSKSRKAMKSLGAAEDGEEDKIKKHKI